LPSRQDAQQSSERTFELCGPHAFADANVFGYGNAQNLGAPRRRIILNAAVAARDEHILGYVYADQAVQTESMIALYQNNVSAAQVVLRGGLHINRFAITNRGRHAGAARLKANVESALQAFRAEGIELRRLRTVFSHAIFAQAIFIRAIFTYATSNHAISSSTISH
jgi:hypothetical protein